jgi:hypothetical protein
VRRANLKSSSPHPFGGIVIASQVPLTAADAARHQRQLIDEITQIAHNWLEFAPASRSITQHFEPIYIRLGALLLELTASTDSERLSVIEVELQTMRTQLVVVRELQTDLQGELPPPDFPRGLESILRPRWDQTLPPTEPLDWSTPEAPNMWHRGQVTISECSYHGNRYGLHLDLGWGYWTPDNRQFVPGRLPQPEPEFLRQFAMRYAKPTDMSPSFRPILPLPNSGQDFTPKGRRYVVIMKNMQQAILLLLDSHRRDLRLVRSDQYEVVL